MHLKYNSEHIRSQKLFLAPHTLSAVAILTAECCGTTDKEYVSGAARLQVSNQPQRLQVSMGQLEIFIQNMVSPTAPNFLFAHYVTGPCDSSGCRG